MPQAVLALEGQICRERDRHRPLASRSAGAGASAASPTTTRTVTRSSATCTTSTSSSTRCRGVMTVSDGSRARGSFPRIGGSGCRRRVEHAIRMSGAVSMRTLYLEPAHRARPAARMPCRRRAAAAARDHPPRGRRRQPRSPRARAATPGRRAARPDPDACRRARCTCPGRPTARRRRSTDARGAIRPRAARWIALARATGASPRTLQRLFRVETGMTLRQLAAPASPRATARGAGGRLLGHLGRARRGLPVGERVRLGFPPDVRRDPRAVFPRSGHAGRRRTGLLAGSTGASTLDDANSCGPVLVRPDGHVA